MAKNKKSKIKEIEKKDSQKDEEEEIEKHKEISEKFHSNTSQLKENIKTDKLREFLTAKNFSPVLEKIQEIPELPDLEQVASSSPVSEGVKEKEDFRYIAAQEQKDGPKYKAVSHGYDYIQKETMQKNENLTLKTPMKSIDIRTAGTNIRKNPHLDALPGTPQMQEMQSFKKQDSEYITEFAGVDESKPFQEKDKKYKIH